MSVAGGTLAQAPASPLSTTTAPNGSVSSTPSGLRDGLPVVEDPMLLPVPDAPQTLRTWQQALHRVRTRSTSVAIAQAQISVAQSQARQALSASLPTVSANAGVTQQLLTNSGARVSASGNLIPPSNEPVWGAGVSLNQRVFDLRSWHNTATANVSTRAASIQARNAERLALGQLADTIVSVITAERLTEVSRVSLRSNLSTLDLTRRRARLGAASAVDVLRSEQEVASNRSDVIQADESLLKAREALGIALGDASGWGVAPGINVQHLATDARSVCSPIENPGERSDVRAAEANVSVSQRNVDGSKYAYSPTVDVSSGFNYFSPSGPARPTQWQVRAVLSVPLYDGGRESAQHSSSIANLEIARQRLTSATQIASLEATQAQRSVTVAKANFEVSQHARKIARESARLARVAFVHGTGTSFDLVEFARRRRLSEIDVTLKEFEVARAQITALLALSNCSL